MAYTIRPVPRFPSSSSFSPKKPVAGTHIEKLPDEILDSVFECAVAVYHYDYRIRATLRRVCKRWDCVVLKNPALWTRISVGVSVAAISDSHDTSAARAHDAKSRNRRKGSAVGDAAARGRVVEDSSKVQQDLGHGEGTGRTSAGKSAISNGGGSGGCGSALGMMPSLEFVGMLLDRSGELKISVGMTVCDLDADTVMVRPVLEDEPTPGDNHEEAWDGEDTEPDEALEGLTTAGSSVNIKMQTAAALPPPDPLNMLMDYFRDLIHLLAEHVHRFRDFHLYFVSEHTAIAPFSPLKTSSSFHSLIALLPLHRGFNLRNVSVTSHLIHLTNSHSSTHTANHVIFNALIRPLPPSVRRLSWQGNTPHIDFTSFAGLKYLTHIDVRGVLASTDVLGIFVKAERAKTIRVHVDSVHAGFANPSGQFTVMENLAGLTIKSGCEAFQVLGTCVKMPKLSVCCIEVPQPVPKQQWHDPATTANGQGNANAVIGGGITIRNAWEWFCAFLSRCPKLKILQLYDPHGAIPIDMIKDIVCAVKDTALGLFIVTPGAEWMQRPEVDEAFWERLQGIRHSREDDVKVTTLRDKEGKAWLSVGWFMEPRAEKWLRSEENEWVKDTGFRWDILDEYHV